MMEFEKLRIIAAYEFLKHIRRKRLYVILGLTLISELAVIILIPLLMDGKYPDNVMTMAATLTVGPSLAMRCTTTAGTPASPAPICSR